MLVSDKTMEEETLLKARRILEGQGESVPLKFPDVGSDKTMEEDTLLKARRILEGEGYHELEVTFGGEGDLQRQLTMCDKNPGHGQFIRIKDFNINHLPPGYRDEDLVDWIKHRADLTVRLTLDLISENRPLVFPGTTKDFPLYKHRGSRMSVTGTGYVGGVYKFTETDNKPCRCKECCRQEMTSRKKNWGTLLIVTAAHVIFDDSEAKQTTCFFFYDDPGAGVNSHVTLRGMEILECYLEQDKCLLSYHTHDIELVEKLDQMVHRCKEAGRKVFPKFMYKNSGQTAEGTSCSVDPEQPICICVSHPHGCHKQVSIGTWTERKIHGTGYYQYMNGRRFHGECTQYTYTTPTCRGSSGALVFSPVRRSIEEGKEWAGLHHPHCEGKTGNINTSGFAWENSQI